ncbi:MAG: hypothetical protein ABI720_13160 [Actinomycetes bacterium]
MPESEVRLPSVANQAATLIALGLHELTGLTAAQIRRAAESFDDADALLVIN